MKIALIRFLFNLIQFLIMWHYANDNIKKKISSRDLSDKQIEEVLKNSELTVSGKMGRLVAQKHSMKIGFGKMLIRVVYEEIKNEKVVVTAYWTKPKRYIKRNEK